MWCGAAGPRERTSENSTQTRFKLSSTGRVFFSVCLCVRASVRVSVRALFKQPDDPHFLLSQSIEEQILRTLTEGIFEIRFLTVRERFFDFGSTF